MTKTRPVHLSRHHAKNDESTALRREYIDRPSYRFLDLFGMIYVMALLVSSFAAAKLVDFGVCVLPGTIIVYSVTYILSDIFTEVYGFRESRRIIWIGLFLLVIANLILYLISVLPPADIWGDQESFAKIFQTSPIYAAATIFGYVSGEFANSYTLAKLKLKTNGKYLWVRTIGSTMVGMVADNIAYALIGYVWFYSLNDTFHMVLSGWASCVAYEALATPVTYRIIGWLKKAEGVDIYDRRTDFTPFRI